jgi:hypothetical protein
LSTTKDSKGDIKADVSRKIQEHIYYTAVAENPTFCFNVKILDKRFGF